MHTGDDELQKKEWLVSEKKLASRFLKENKRAYGREYSEPLNKTVNPNQRLPLSSFDFGYFDWSPGTFPVGGFFPQNEVAYIYFNPVKIFF